MNKTINNKKRYSLVEASKFTPFTSREILAGYIKKGHLPAEVSGSETRMRYRILGKDLANFIKRYKEDKTSFYENSRFCPVFLKQTLDFCKRVGIRNIGELSAYVAKYESKK